MYDQIGSTPLLSAMVDGYASTARLLLLKGANIDHYDWVSNMMLRKHVISVPVIIVSIRVILNIQISIISFI
jgi:hypothetical protein